MTPQPFFSLHFSLFSTALCDLSDSRPVHFFVLTSHLFFLSALSSSLFHCALQDGFGQDLMNGHDRNVMVLWCSTADKSQKAYLRLARFIIISYSWSPTGMSTLIRPLQHVSGKDHDRCLRRAQRHCQHWSSPISALMMTLMA